MIIAVLLIFIFALSGLALILYLIWRRKTQMKLWGKIVLSLIVLSPLAFVFYLIFTIVTLFSGLEMFDFNTADNEPRIYNENDIQFINGKLESIGMALELPEFEVKNIDMTDKTDTYERVVIDVKFDEEINSLKPQLDSLIQHNDRWHKEGDCYYYEASKVRDDEEWRDTFRIYPSRQIARHSYVIKDI